MDNVVINNGPRKTEDNYQEIGGAARKRLELARFHSTVTIGEYVRGHFGIIGYTSKALVSDFDCQFIINTEDETHG